MEGRLGVVLRVITELNLFNVISMFNRGRYVSDGNGLTNRLLIVVAMTMLFSSHTRFYHLSQVTSRFFLVRR